jgi:ATP-dependent Clp protease ATP-binding subunit ClpA
MFEKFTERARKVMSLSRQETQHRNEDFISTEHALIAILREGGGVGAKALKNLGIDLMNLIPAIDNIVPPKKQPSVLLGQIPFSPRMKRVIELAGEEACRAGNDVVGTEHLLLGLFLEGEGVAAKVLGQFDVTEDRIRKELQRVLGDQAGRISRSEVNPKTGPIRVTLYRPAEGPMGEQYLIVNNIVYLRVQSVTLDGVPIDKRGVIAQSVAQNLGYDVYMVEPC